MSIKQTPLDLFIDSLPERFKNAILNTCTEEIEKAKETEKQHIKDAYNQGYRDGESECEKKMDEDIADFNDADFYYEITYIRRY